MSVSPQESQRREDSDSTYCDLNCVQYNLLDGSNVLSDQFSKLPMNQKLLWTRFEKFRAIHVSARLSKIVITWAMSHILTDSRVSAESSVFINVTVSTFQLHKLPGWSSSPSCLSIRLTCLDPGIVFLSGRERDAVDFPDSLQHRVKQANKKCASRDRCLSTFQDDVQMGCASIVISMSSVRIMNHKKNVQLSHLNSVAICRKNPDSLPRRVKRKCVLSFRCLRISQMLNILHADGSAFPICKLSRPGFVDVKVEVKLLVA